MSKRYIEVVDVAEDGKKMNDLISRQAAIDIERNATVDTNPSHFEAHQKFTQYIDDAEISSFGRWQWSNGFNTALTAVGIDLKKLPSAQPEQRWIPCSERLPENNDPVNVTWVNHNPEVYYADIKDKPFTATAHYHNGRWYWFSSVTQDYLNEYDVWTPDLVDKDVEITAWMPLPEPYMGTRSDTSDRRKD